MSYTEFIKEVEAAVNVFKTLPKTAPVRIVSHLDADGICACSILVKALIRENRNYSISIIPQLEKDALEEFSREHNEIYFFTDLGSGMVKSINTILKNKTVFILDHHEPESLDNFENITHINPHKNRIDGSKEVSGAGVVYYFAKTLNKKNENLAHLALIGAIGDIQEKRDFFGLNKEILKIAQEKKKIKVLEGLRLFGTQTKPLHKVLEYSTDPYIPGVTGSESAVIQFLQSININPKHGHRWRKLREITNDEMKRLVAGIVMKREGEEKPEDIIGKVYLILGEEEGSPTRDAREFSTLLNACGRMNKSSIGIGCCLNDKRMKRKAISTLNMYKREIIGSLNWVNTNRKNKTEYIIEKEGYIIINAQENIPPTIVGTIASILSKSSEIEDHKYILSLAHTVHNKTKVSLRISGRDNSTDLTKTINSIVKKVRGESGGHKNAAGAIIDTDDEEMFIKNAVRVLDKESLEESIL